jgi:hypothetical protein
MSRGRFIVWLDQVDAPIVVRYRDGLPVEEIIFHHKNYLQDGTVVHAVHVRVERSVPVHVFYKVELIPGDKITLMPVSDSDGYRDVPCGIGVEYVSAR